MTVNLNTAHRNPPSLVGGTNLVLLTVLFVYIQELLDMHSHFETKVWGTPVCCVRCGLRPWQSFHILRTRHFLSWATLAISTAFDVEGLRLEEAASLAPISSAWKTPSVNSWTKPVVDDSEVYAPNELVRANTSATLSPSSCPSLNILGVQ